MCKIYCEILHFMSYILNGKYFENYFNKNVCIKFLKIFLKHRVRRSNDLVLMPELIPLKPYFLKYEITI